MNEILAALFGAFVAGLYQTIDKQLERGREKESVLVALASEVDAICRLIRHQNYHGEFLEIAENIKSGDFDGSGFVIDIRENYFSVFEGLTEKLGLIEPHRLSKIVNFYAYCKSVIDSTRVDGPFAGEVDLQYAAGNATSVARLLAAILSLGDEIVQMPKAGSLYQLPPSAETGE